MKRAIWTALGLVSAMTVAAVQAKETAALPLTPARTLDYQVSSGTFMSLAVSPDGKTMTETVVYFTAEGRPAMRTNYFNRVR